MKNATIGKIIAGAVPVLLIGSLSLATLSAQTDVLSQFQAAGRFALAVDGVEHSVNAPFDVPTLKPGETTTKVIRLDNDGDVTAYTYLKNVTAVGDPDFIWALHGSVTPPQEYGTASSARLTELTSLTQTSGAWAIPAHGSIFVTLAVSAASDSTAVIEGTADVVFHFEALSADPRPTHEITVQNAIPGTLAAQTRYADFVGDHNAFVISPLDVAGVGERYSPADIWAGNVPYTVTDLEYQTLYWGTNQSVFVAGASHIMGSQQLATGDHVVTFTVNELDRPNGQILSSTQHKLVVHFAP